MARTRSTSSVLASILLLTFLFSVGAVQAQTTAFTYEGKLTDAGNPANGNYDLQFRLFDTVTVGTGAQQGATIVRNPVAASAGVFTVTLDFGANVFGGADRYLEIGVRPAGSANPYTILAPRQPVTASPYAIQTLNTQQLGGLPANRYLVTNASGNVGIGTTTPATKLDVNGGIRAFFNGSTQVVAETTGGTNSWARLYMATPNRRWFWGSSQNFNGDQVHLFDETSGQFRMTVQPNGGAISFPLGNVGIGTTNPQAKLQVDGGSSAGVLANSQGNAIIGYSSTPSFAAVYGENTSNSTGFGVYGKGTSGYAMFAEGNAGQSRDKGGWVKAMIYVDPFLPASQYIVRCYNGITNSSTGNCGFSMVRVATGDYRINFGFQITDRFFSLSVPTPLDIGAIGVSSTNEIYVVSNAVFSDGSHPPSDTRFYVIVY